MNVSYAISAGTTLFAAEPGGDVTAWVFDLPTEVWQWSVATVVVLALAVYVVWMYIRDTATMSRFWTVWLGLLRLSVLVGLAIIALNPQERSQTMSFRPSRVAILVDSSLSMDDPESLPGSSEKADGEESLSRANAVEKLLADSPLIASLQKDHDVSIYTFDTTLSNLHHVFRSLDPRAVRLRNTNASSENNEAKDESAEPTENADPADNGDAAKIAWDQVLQPRGLETRLGESLQDIIRKVAGSTLSGVIVFTDGASNAGIEPRSAVDVAKVTRTRLFPIGLGSTEEQVNLQVAGVQAPTVVHRGDDYQGDPFEITALIKGQGLEGRTAEVELLARPLGSETEPTQVQRREIVLVEDGVPVPVKFEQAPADVGGIEYFVRTHAPSGVREFRDDDNERTKTVKIVKRKTRVLVIAGGPMRDYRFVTSMLDRHPGIQVDVWLQTADPGTAISQNADKLLLEFPQTREEFFGTDDEAGYDVVLAFDVNWKAISAESIAMLQEWVFAHAGGLFLIAGDVYTQDVGSDDPVFDAVRELYPVVLSPAILDLLRDQDDGTAQAWPIDFTEDGENAGFLQLADDAQESKAVWKEFPGVYEAYPTSAPKAGAMVYANFSNPEAYLESPPILLASQFYGSGRTMYLGSPEIWRLRSLDEEYFDRFWIKAVRELAQSRMKRGTNRGLLLPERQEYYLGQTVRIRARLLDAQFKPLLLETVDLELFEPTGRPMIPAPQLRRDKDRPGEYVADFRAGMRGKYKFELTIPDSDARLAEEVEVRLPNLEFDNSRQNVQLLRSLAEETGGNYYTLDEVAQVLPKKLPNRGETFQIDERLRTLWDRKWVLYLLVALLSVEWLTRKLLKLA